MKPQDIIFIIILALLFYKRDPRYFAAAGLASLALSIPLFYEWVFFTAQRLVLYAFIFFTVSTFWFILNLRKI
jgi:hypothetical protein